MSQRSFEQFSDPHEKYEMMCALAAAHELDLREEQTLDRHLQECAACRKELDGFRAAAEELVQTTAHAPVLDEKAHGAAFVKFAKRQGLALSKSAQKAVASGLYRRTFSPLALTCGIAAVAVCAIAAALIVVKQHSQTPQQAVIAEVVPASVAQASGALHEDDRIADLESRLEQAQLRARELPALERKLQASQEQRANLETGIAQRDAEISRLKTGALEVQTQMATVQATIVSLTRKNEDLTADLVAEHAHSTSLSDDLSNEKTAAEQDRQLTAATREVRDLMGARRLFMIDVYDGDDRQRAGRSFGRVFYTEGKSLIFYAFDLDKKGTAKRVTFAAWGQRGKDPATVKQLGVFQTDDVAQKRWVMKVDNPEKLRAIDAIFVTVESRPSPDHPTGQKLLYAYLGGQPNHP